MLSRPRPWRGWSCRPGKNVAHGSSMTPSASVCSSLGGGPVTEIMVNGADDVFVSAPAGRRVPTRLASGGGSLPVFIDRVVSSVNRRVDESSPDGGRPPARVNASTSSSRHSPWMGRSITIRRFSPALPPRGSVAAAACLSRPRIFSAPWWRRGQHSHLGRNRLRKTINALRHDPGARASSPSRTPPSFRSSPTWCSGRRALPTSRDAVRSPYATCAQLPAHASDRIIVGEVLRWTLDMLQAMNTGHEARSPRCTRTPGGRAQSSGDTRLDVGRRPPGGDRARPDQRRHRRHRPAGEGLGVPGQRYRRGHVAASRGVHATPDPALRLVRLAAARGASSSAGSREPWHDEYPARPDAPGGADGAAA